MADISRTVEIIFGAIDRNTKSTINEIESNLATFDSGLQSIATPIGNFTENLLKAEGAVLALAAAYGGYAVNEAAKFQTAQSDLAKVLSDTDPTVESFTATVTDLSEQYGISAAAILQGIANFKQAGFTAQEAAELQKNALDLMIAGDIDAARASEILVSSIKGFGAESSVAARYVEALNNVSNQYATDVNQLAEGMSRVAPILQTMGFSFEEGTGLLTPMIEVFRDGGVAAEALKTGLLKLVDDAKPVTTALAALGVSQTDLNGQMRSGRDIFYDVAASFQNLDQNQKLVFASQLFGLEQAPKLVTVFDNLAKVNAITATAMEKTGSVALEVEVRLSTAEKQVDRFTTAFNNLARVLGGEILANFSGIVGGATEIETAFRKIVEDGGLKPLFDALKPQLAEFEELLKTVARNLPEAFKDVDFTGLLSAFDDFGLELKDAFARMFGDVDVTSVEGLTSAIQTTVNIIASFVNVTKGIIDQFDPIFDAIGAAGQQISGASDETAASTGKMLAAFTILSDFGTGLGAVLLVIKETQADVLGVFDTLVGGARIFTNTLQIAFDLLALTLVGALEQIVFSIGNFFDAIGADTAAAKFFSAGSELKLTADGIKANMASNAGDMRDAWVQMTNGLTGESGKAATAIESVGVATEKPKEGVKALTLHTGELSEGMKAAGFSINPVTGLLENLGQGAATTAGDVDGLTQKLVESVDATTKATGGFRTFAEAEEYLAANAKAGNAQFIEYKDGLYQVTSGSFDAADSSKALANETNKATLAANEGSKEWKAVQDVMLATQKQTDDFQIAMGKLANERYEIDVQANVDLQTAQIEADTARIAAAFTAASEAISTLTQGTTDLYGLFAEKAGFLGSDELLAAAQRMEERLDAELELKRQMTEAAVAQANATTLRLSSGEPLISIDAGTLAPELELVFDKILKFTQIRATQEGLSLLVGL